MSRFLEIARNIEHAQSKGCWLYIQVRHTALWFRGNLFGSVRFRIHIATPYLGWGVDCYREK